MLIVTIDELPDMLPLYSEHACRMLRASQSASDGELYSVAFRQLRDSLATVCSSLYGGSVHVTLSETLERRRLELEVHPPTSSIS